MRNLKLIAMMLVLPLYAADNEIYVDQAGATLNLDLEQLGSGNIIGGLTSTAGSLTPLDLDGATMTLDINQIGSSNTFLGDIQQSCFLSPRVPAGHPSAFQTHQRFS